MCKCGKLVVQDPRNPLCAQLMYLRTLPVKMPRPNPCTSASFMLERPIHNPHSSSLPVPPMLPPSSTPLLFAAPEALIIVGNGQVSPPHPLSSGLVSAKTTAIQATKNNRSEAFDIEQFEGTYMLVDPILSHYNNV